METFGSVSREKLDKAKKAAESNSNELQLLSEKGSTISFVSRRRSVAETMEQYAEVAELCLTAMKIIAQHRTDIEGWETQLLELENLAKTLKLQADQYAWMDRPEKTS